MQNLNKYPVSAVAKALVKQHGFDHDIAYLRSWYSRHEFAPNLSRNQMFAAMMMMKVRNIPTVTEKDAEEMLKMYGKRRGGKTHQGKT